MRGELVSKLRNSLPSLANDLVFADVAAPIIEKGIIAEPEYRQILARATDCSKVKLLVELLAGKEDAAFDVFLEILRVDYSWLVDEIQDGAGCSCSGDVTDSVPFVAPDVASHQNMRNHCLELARTDSPPGCRKRCASPSSPGPTSSKRPTTQNTERSDGTARRKRPSPLATSATQSEQTSVILSPREQNHVNTTKENSRINKTADEIKLSQGITEEMMSLVKNNHRTSRDWTSLAHALGLSRLVNKIRVKVLVFGEDLDVCVLYLLQEWAGNNPKVATLLRLLQALRAEGFNDVADELVEKFAT